MTRGMIEQGVKDSSGYEPGYTHYLYVLEFEREPTRDTYYYVGRTGCGKSGLVDEIRRYAKSLFSAQRPIQKDGADIFVTHDQHEYDIQDIERIVTLTDAPEDDYRGNGYGKNEERKLAYRIAIEYDTTNVIGGK